MPPVLFYLFSLIAIAGALGVVILRNPVSCALSLVVSFLGVAALFIGMNAFFIGTIQILVYAGAIMVLFLFIIMLLDLPAETSRKSLPILYVAGGGVFVIFVGLVSTVLNHFPQGDRGMPFLPEEMQDDVKVVGQLLYTDFTFPLQVVGVLLLVATVGVVVLSKRQLN